MNKDIISQKYIIAISVTKTPNQKFNEHLLAKTELFHLHVFLDKVSRLIL